MFCAYVDSSGFPALDMSVSEEVVALCAVRQRCLKLCRLVMLLFAEHFFRTLQVMTWFRQTFSKPISVETRVLSQGSPCEIFGDTKWHWNSFFSECLDFPECQSTDASRPFVHLSAQYSQFVHS